MEIGQRVKYKDSRTSGEGVVVDIGKGEYVGQFLVEIGINKFAYFDRKTGRAEASKPHTCRYYTKDNLEVIENHYQIY